jgi:class I fructose-bisphosphate aldolase
MNAAKTVRLNHIFSSDKRTVVIAMDHGLPGMAPLGHLTHPEELLQQIRAGGADAILTTPGIAAHYAEHIGRLGLIIRLDGGATTLADSFGEMRLIASVEDALRLGADAVAVMGFCGTADEGVSLERLGKVATECRALGMPLMAEMLPLGYQGKPNVQQVVAAARIGAEMGADIIKTKYVGSPEEYNEVTQTCFVPVLTLGGSARSSDEVLSEIHAAMRAGAAGVAVGRNVWQSDDAVSITRLIVNAVHGMPGER